LTVEVLPAWLDPSLNYEVHPLIASAKSPARPLEEEAEESSA
jgi:hypothetical protein